MIKIFQNTNYNFIGAKNITKIACIVILVMAIVPGLIQQLSGNYWFNWGVDFTGGTIAQVSFTQPTDEAQLRSVVEPVAPGAQITRFGDENEFLIRTGQFEDGAIPIIDRLNAGLREHYGTNFTVERAEAVGPKVGSELQTKAVLAVLLSFAATLIYLSFRLEWSLGVAGIIATIVDLMFTLGYVATFRLEVSLVTIAALLTIIGYSLNDKIVIFDRIRENLRASRGRGDFAELVNRSVNETIPRTVMTGGSVLAVLLVLFLFGGIAIRDFALIMFLGIVAGTISSMFVAPVVLVYVRNRYVTAKASDASSAKRINAAL